MIGPHFCLEEWVKPSLSTSFNQGYPPAISLGKFGIFFGGRKNPLWQCVTLPETNSNFAPENGCFEDEIRFGVRRFLAQGRFLAVRFEEILA